MVFVAIHFTPHNFSILYAWVQSSSLDYVNIYVWAVIEHSHLLYIMSAYYAWVQSSSLDYVNKYLWAGIEHNHLLYIMSAYYAWVQSSSLDYVNKWAMIEHNHLLCTTYYVGILCVSKIIFSRLCQHICTVWTVIEHKHLQYIMSAYCTMHDYKHLHTVYVHVFPQLSASLYVCAYFAFKYTYFSMRSNIWLNCPLH